MTSEGLWEMFEGDSADTRAGKFPLVPMGGLSGGSRVRGHRSEDPHRRERKFILCNNNGKGGKGGGGT